MGWTNASRWDDDVELSWDPAEPARAKPVVRRTPAAWSERDGAWHASIGGWAVRIARGPDGWEWSAFAPSPRSGPRALRCTGFDRREAAQRDAETALSALA
jgi:hypothetical protein